MCIYYVREVSFYWNFLKPVPFLGQLCFLKFEAADFFKQSSRTLLDLILQIFSTDTSYLVLKDTSRIPSPFSRPLDVFASLEDLWPFQTPQTNMIYSVLLQNKPEDLSKLLEKKCGEKKRKLPYCKLYNMSAAETIETHAKALTDTQCQKIPTTTTWGTISN